MSSKPLLDSPLVLFGFGAQGEAEATNLKKSGVDFKIALREGGPSWKAAQNAGFSVTPLDSALEGGETVILNLPDQVQAKIYRDHIASQSPKRLVFAHGFNTHFKLIELEKNGPPHILVAPKGAASGLQEFYKTPQALPAILAIESLEEEKKEDRLWAESYALAIGCHPKGLVWASFKDETECDLFSEQAFLCGGLSSLLRTTYEVLVESGYNKETAYYETLYELKLIVDLLWKKGITGMRNKISPTALYGDVTRGDRVIDSHVKNKMKEVLKEIQSGEFTKDFLENYDKKDFRDKTSKDETHPIEEIGAPLRQKLFGD